MIPCPTTMRSTFILNCILATWLVASIGAITVSIDRSDSKPPQPTRSSMIANGWRPLANGYEETLGTNVSPSSNLERSVAPHPVHNKLQEHMAQSEKLKPHRKNKPASVSISHQDYNPPSILGSFTVFGHAATKARVEAQQNHNHVNKHLPSETREYSFLVPPPKDVYRFELDHHRKPIIRESTAYVNVRQPQYIPQPIHQPPDPVRAATYFIKGYTSTTNSPSSPVIPQKNRHYSNGYPMPQVLQPPRHQAKPFESLKISNNAKPYFQPPGVSITNDFTKDKRVSEHDHRPNYDRFQSQQHGGQALGQAGAGSYYSQVNHPPHQSHHYKTSYERDPAFLVHESHEVSYVTAPTVYNGYNLRPSLPYDTLLPPDVYTSTQAPTTLASRLQVPHKYPPANDVNREQDYKRPVQGSPIKQIDTGAQAEPLPTSGISNGNTYYVSEHQDLTPPPSAWPLTKTKYTSDINEVLPRVNPPSKFNQDIIAPNQIPQAPKVVYVRPGIHYQSSVLPLDIRQQTSAPEYETPESISLKHFNEQQFIIQQQLIQRDRQRLAEQERQQQLEIERQQQEELKKRQEELKQLIQQQKLKEEEEARLEFESVKNQSEQLTTEGQRPQAPQPLQPYTVQLAEYEIPKVTTVATSVLTEQSGFGEQPKIQEAQVVQPEYPVSQRPEPVNQQYHEQVQVQPEDEYNSYREPEVVIRPQRPQKINRDQYRRRKPTTVAYEVVPTEVPIQTPETSLPVTLHAEEVPVQTTIAPETITQPTVANTQRPRLRRPGQPGLRRRRPTTTTQEPVTISNVEDFLKYNKGEDTQQQLDVTRRRRIKPTQQTYEESVTERRPNIRKRPGHRTRVNPGEPFEAEIVTEIVHTPVSKDSGDSQAYNENSQYVTTHPSNQYYDYTSQKLAPTNEQREDTTEPTVLEYLTEVSRGKVEETTANEDHHRHQSGGAVTNIPLEDLFVRTEGNYFDRATVSPTTATTTTTTAATTSAAQPATQLTHVPSSTTRPLKMRPIRYGNATRPRFSIKDYKSRLDYKTRLSQMSSTESSSTPASHRQRTPAQKSQQNQAQQQQVSDPSRETTGRYKYVSRMNYRTTTPTPSREQEQPVDQEATSSTTEKSNRFVPKRRPINGNVYRSRISGTTSSPNRSQNHESENYPRQSTARPENVFSSSVRRRPLMKSRLHAQKETTATSTQHAGGRREEYATEMTAEETSFYSAVTTSPTVRVLANEIPLEKEEAASTKEPVEHPVEEEAAKTTADFEQASNHGWKAEAVVSANPENPLEEHQVKEPTNPEDHPVPTTKVEDKKAHVQEQPDAESTTKFAVTPDEEELFAKASLSVADLTSSASALYDKPGLFKAVSPESRVVASHFKITTDEPTLPIEAFFQELTKAN